MLCAASACVNGTGMLHTALCTPACVHPAPPSFVPVSLFHIPAFYWIWRVMRNFLAFLHTTRSSWLCSKELQTRSCCPASHLLSHSRASLVTSAVVPAEPGSCSDHPCPWSRSKCPAHSSKQQCLLPEHCSPRGRFLGENHRSRGDTLVESPSFDTILFDGKPKPQCLFMIFFCTYNWLFLHHLKTWVRWG